MNSRTKTGLEILQVAILVGVLGDVLLREMPWGLNVTLFVAAFAGGMAMLLRRRAPEFLTGNTIALFGAMIFFGAMFTWRDSIELRVADALAIIAITAVLFLPRMKVPTQLAGVFHYGVAFVWAGCSAAFAPILLLISDVEWKTIPRAGWTRHLFSVLRGIAVATPILIIFGALFVAADAVYQGWVERVFNVKPDVVISHVFLTAFFGWMTAGYLRGVLVKNDHSDARSAERKSVKDAELSPDQPNHLSIIDHINKSDPPNPFKDVAENAADAPKSEEKRAWAWTDFDNAYIPSVFTFGTIEVSVILGLINLLFLSFVIVQVPYLFGGMDLVQNTPDFKLAEYARRGFGELVAVSALVLPILLASHWLIRKGGSITEKIFRVLAGVQIVLLFVIMASAVQRLVLLTGNLGYGLTTIRLYPMIFMTWLAIVFVWFGATVLRGARNHFAWGALWAAFFVLGATHLLNPDAFIVKTNTALMREGRDFDAEYNAGLSDDAIPILLDGLTDMSEANRAQVYKNLAWRNCQKKKETDLRSWNYSRLIASTALAAYESVLINANGCFPSKPE